LRLYKEYLTDKDQVNSLKFGLLGNSNHHQMIPCPPVIETLMKERENLNINPMPWPLDAKHMVLNRAFFIVMCHIMQQGMLLIPLMEIIDATLLKSVIF